MLALTGTPVNVLVSEASAQAGAGGFGFFEFAIVGVPLLLGTMAIIVLFGERLLPHRSGEAIPADLSRHATTLMEQYRLADGLFQMRVRPGSPWVGAPHAALDLRRLSGPVARRRPGRRHRRPAVAAGARGGRHPAGARRRRDGGTPGLREGARLPLAGRGRADVADTLFNRVSGLAEVVIPPRSGLIGQLVFPGMVTESGDLIILAVQRQGEDLGPGETALATGDTLLLQGTWKALDEHLGDPNVLVVDSPELVRRQAVPMGRGANLAIGVLLAMVVALATGVVPSVVAGLRRGVRDGAARRAQRRRRPTARSTGRR